MCMTFPIAVSTIGIKSCEKDEERASEYSGCWLPEDGHISSHVLNIERNKILAGPSWLVETCRHSQLPSHPQQSDGVRRLKDIKFNPPAYGSGSTTYQLPSPTFEPLGPLV